MKNFTRLLVFLLIISTFNLSGQNIVFSGNDLPATYFGHEVTFNQTLHVCGRGYKRLILSYKRQVLPYETAAANTQAYTDAENAFANAFITAYCPNISVDTIRLGATITNAVATITDERNISISGNIKFGNNTRPTSRPAVGNARLIVCAANVENYFPEWEGTNGATSNEEYQRQHTKMIKAFRNIDADIYCLAEIQDGTIALQAITHALNSQTAPNRYAYVDDGDYTTDTYSKVGYIYRTDKVTPVLTLGHPYNSSSVYYKREYVQAFDELSTNERFVISMNHFKAKTGTDDNTNDIRMANVSKLIDFLTIKLNSNYYQDKDFLILGDMNCGTMEEPITFLTTMGFENQTARFAPNEYSYSFNNGVEYLDHAFATPTMAKQITGVAPYHINADESDAFYFLYGTDQSMYKYSDHDPIIVGLALSSDVAVGDMAEKADAEIYAYAGSIFIENSNNSVLTVYDMLGRTIYNNPHADNVAINVRPGIYIVRVGNTVKKIAVSE